MTVDETQDELGDSFLTQVVFEESFGASGVTGWLNKTIEGRADLYQVDSSDLDQCQDETGDKVESSWVKNKMASQDILEGFMLHLATFPARDLVAAILMFLRR